MANPKKPTFADMNDFVNKDEPEAKKSETPEPVEGNKTKAAPTEKKKAGRPKVGKYEAEVPMTVRIPKKIHKALKSKSVDVEKPMAELVVDALKHYLKI